MPLAPNVQTNYNVYQRVSATQSLVKVSTFVQTLVDEATQKQTQRWDSATHTTPPSVQAFCYSCALLCLHSNTLNELPFTKDTGVVTSWLAQPLVSPHTRKHEMLTSLRKKENKLISMWHMKILSS
ncbi:hypothetical protein FQA47_022741 [Oryzias melastigma]|uniref:Uncharacterized protein n=1 Tax=Oryzias melastigma TaxID=30732 RepID=A0A834FG99_ORYME|nr:hypothetical protein FQA47_022741 [Oryzias melastigma]